jgi:hypothetical protein
MTDRTYTLKGKQFERYLIEFMAEAEMSQNDTITIGDFTASSNIPFAAIVKQSDGTQLTCTISNNVVTLTSPVVANTRVIIFAMGIAA